MRAATQKLPPREHTHGRSVYKHYPGIPQRERQVRCYVTRPKASSISSRLSPGRLLLRLDSLAECCFSMVWLLECEIKKENKEPQPRQCVSFSKMRRGRETAFLMLMWLFYCTAPRTGEGFYSAGVRDQASWSGEAISDLAF